MVREIPLTRGMVALVDDADYERAVGAGKWHAHAAAADSEMFYARRSIYRGQSLPLRCFFLHTLLTGWEYVDHINGDGLDNRRANLRAATHSQNMANKRIYRNNKSGFKGVHLTEKGRWRTQIKVAGQKRHIGYFDTAEAAARAYDAAAREAFGDFARPNFPEESAA